VTEPPDQPAKPLRTWRPMALWTVGLSSLLDITNPGCPSTSLLLEGGPWRVTQSGEVHRVISAFLAQWRDCLAEKATSRAVRKAAVKQ
jgi:hypothetical protein